MKIENTYYIEKLGSLIDSFNQRMHGYPLKVSLLISNTFELVSSPEDGDICNQALHNYRTISDEDGFYTFYHVDILGRTLSMLSIDADMNVATAVLSSITDMYTPYDGGEIINMYSSNVEDISAPPVVGGQKDIDAVLTHFFKN